MKLHVRTKSLRWLTGILVGLTVAVLGLAGCSNTPPSSPTPVAPGKTSTLPTPKSSPSPAIDPNAPPAAFKLSNLRAVSSPEDGANVYSFYVDVENVGGQPGTYQASYRIDNGPEKSESKKTTVNPGQKKSLELIGPEQEILLLGQAYDEGLFEEKEHLVFVGDLFKAITLAERWKLQMFSSIIENASGNITVSGDVKNISGAKLERVVVVIDIRVTDQKIMWIYKWPKPAETSVANEPLMPGQTTAFKVVIPNTIPQGLEVVDYRVWFKDASGTAIRTKASSG